MPYTLPPATDFTGSTVTEGQFKTALTTMREFINEAMGSSSSAAAYQARTGTATAPSMVRYGGVAGIALTSTDQVTLISKGMAGGDTAQNTVYADKGVNFSSQAVGTTDRANVWNIAPTVISTSAAATQYGFLWNLSYTAGTVPTTFYGSLLQNQFSGPAGTATSMVSTGSVSNLKDGNLTNFTSHTRFQAADINNLGSGWVGTNYGFNVPDMSEGTTLIAGYQCAINELVAASTISTIARASNVVTVTTAATNTMRNGQSVVVAGVTDSSFNGTFTVASIVDSTHFTYAQTAANASSSGGTALISGLTKYAMRMGGTAANYFGGFVLQKRAPIDQSYTYQAPTTGFSITIGDTVGSLLLNPAGTLATGTVNMPANPTDGQEVVISSTQIVTALTMSGNGKTLNGGLTTIAANGFGRWIYRIGGTMWHRAG